MLIHGKTLNDNDSKLSLILPTLNVKSLFKIYGVQSSSDDNEIKLPDDTDSASLTFTGISVVSPNLRSPDFTFGSKIVKSGLLLVA